MTATSRARALGPILGATLGALLAACGAAPAPSATAPTPAPAPAVPPAPAPAQEPPAVIQTAVPQELTFPEEAFRAVQPAAGAPRPLSLPRIKPFTLRSGIKVYLVEQHTLPIVSLDLNFDGGSRMDPPGKEGLASLCMGLIGEGTVARDKIAYNEALADLASSVNSYATLDSHGLSLSSLSKNLEPTLALFRETLLTPGLRAPDLERLSKRRIESIRQAKSTPASIAGRVSDAVLFGPTHPLGALETEATVAQITLEDCRQHAARWLRPRGARLFVVGDLTEAQVRQAFDGPELAGWTGAVPARPPLPRPQTLPGRIFLVHVPGAAQSQVQLLHFGPKRVSPQYFANTLLGAVFGGGFTSRINMNLREDKGYSYGARGGFSYTRDHGTFSASASVRTDATYQALIELDRELKALWSGERPVTAEELEREKTGAILSLPGRFATSSAALGQYRALVYYGLPLDTYASYVAKVSSVTARELRAAAAKNLRPGQAVVLVVGDADAKMITRSDGKDVPLTRGGQQLTLRQALAELATRGELGGGGLVTLDADARVMR